MGGRPPVGWRQPALHILGLWAVGVAQPLLDLLGKNPTFFVAHRADPIEVVAFVAALLLLVPAAVTTALWLLGRIGGRAIHAAALAGIVAVLVAAAAMPAIKLAGVQTSAVAAPLAVAAGVAAAWAYGRTSAAKFFATALAVSAVVVPVLFFAQPGVRRLLVPPPAPGTGEVRPRPGAPQPSPVLLVIMDEVPLLSLLDRRGLLDDTLYPNLAGLAREGVWFRNATAVSDDTRWAVPAIVSGRYPQATFMPTLADYPHTLFTQLASSHRLEVVEAITRLCRFAACNEPRTPFSSRVAALADDLRILYLHHALTDDLRRGLPSLAADWARWGVAGAVERHRRRAERVQRRTNNMQIASSFAGWISREDPQPVFYFLHSLLPHSPWQWLPSGQQNTTRAPLSDADVAGVPETEWGVTQLYQRHLLQAAAVDHVVGLYVRRLKEERLYDRALVIVAADHGVAFQPGLPRREFREETAAEIMRVPLLVKFPAGERRVPGTIEDDGQTISDRNAETIDIGPTVLDVLGLEATTSKPDGGSLRRPLGQERPAKRMVFADGAAWHSYGPQGPDIRPALARKLERFGEGAANPFRIPRPARYAGLLGRPVTGLAVRDGGGRAVVDDLSRFTDFRSTPEATPFDLSGRLESPSAGSGATWVAVAVNGTIGAVTRTWDAEPLRWLATVPLPTWRQGHNDVEVFLVRGDERKPTLVRTTLSGGGADSGG